MTYNVFGTMLSLAQSINLDSVIHPIASWVRSGVQDVHLEKLEMSGNLTVTREISGRYWLRMTNFVIGNI